MRVEQELPGRYKPPRDWMAIRNQLREHAGKWVEVDKDSPLSTAWRINTEDQSPRALRDDPAYTYEAATRDVNGTRCALWVRATPREKE